jgi:putative hemolysin
MELLIIIILVLCNGLFAMSELALLSSRKFKLENARKKGKSGAKTALELAENPTKFLSTVQIGITVIGILLGIYSGENITNDVAVYFREFDLTRPYADTIATFAVLLVITYLSIVLGELFPKRVGMTYPEPIAMTVAKPMSILSRISSPFVWLLTATNNFLLTIFGIKTSQDNSVSEEEIKSIIAESTESGEIDEIEQNIVERVFELGDRKVNSLLTHRGDLIYFDINDSWVTVKKKINEEKHSSYLVCKNHNIDDVLGIVILKDLFGDHEKSFKLQNYLKQPVFLNEQLTAYKVLEKFQSHKMHYGVVVDEYGSTQGMVTMDDVVDALIGDTTQADQVEYSIVQRDENTWLVDGVYSLLEFQKYFQLNLDDDLLERYATVAGIFLHINNDLPLVGDKVKLEDLTLEVMDKDGQKIDKVLVTKGKEI